MCPVSIVLNFVQSLLDRGFIHIKGVQYISAISACHTRYSDSTVAAHLLVKHFLLGVWHLKSVASPVFRSGAESFVQSSF